MIPAPGTRRQRGQDRRNPPPRPRCVAAGRRGASGNTASGVPAAAHTSSCRAVAVAERRTGCGWPNGASRRPRTRWPPAPPPASPAGPRGRPRARPAAPCPHGWRPRSARAAGRPSASRTSDFTICATSHPIARAASCRRLRPLGEPADVGLEARAPAPPPENRSIARSCARRSVADAISSASVSRHRRVRSAPGPRRTVRRAIAPRALWRDLRTPHTTTARTAGLGAPRQARPRRSCRASTGRRACPPPVMTRSARREPGAKPDRVHHDLDARATGARRGTP